jgi:hypothetical protein
VQRLENLGQRLQAREIDPPRVVGAEERVEVTVDEARDQGRPAQIDDLRPGGPPGGDVVSIADGDDRAVGDGHARRSRPRRVEGASPSVDEDEVGDGRDAQDHRGSARDEQELANGSKLHEHQSFVFSPCVAL